MKKIIILSLFISSFAFAQPKIDFSQFYPIERSHSYIEFSIKYMGYAKVRGRFADFSGMVRYDQLNPERTSVSLGLKVESIDTDLDFRDNDLKSDNWFDAKLFPLISFTSKSVLKTGEGFDMRGDLTIKGITKEVVLKMNPPSGVLKDVRKDDQVIFTGGFTLDRTDYKVEGKNWSGIKEGITAVDNIVNIEFSILGKQVKAENYFNRVKNTESPAGKIYKAVKEKNVKEGIDVFSSLKEAGTADRNALAAVGYMLVLEGNVKGAITLYEANLKAFPEAPEVYYDLGEAYGLTGDLTKSKSYYQEALKKNPTYFWAIEVLRHF